MTDLIATTTEKSLELQTRTLTALTDLYGRLTERMRDERGQTSAEYLGVIVVIGAIIAVLATSDIGDKLKDLILDGIGRIGGD